MNEKVSVYSAYGLTESDKSRIESVFRKKHSDAVDFFYSVDSSLIGGLLIVDGNDYYDSTVAGRLAKVKRTLR